jgi:hypothetical protein
MLKYGMGIMLVVNAWCTSKIDEYPKCNLEYSSKFSYPGPPVIACTTTSFQSDVDNLPALKAGPCVTDSNNKQVG